ncbi:hypothetical protein Rsub_07283 [Raphidocelis subcapitata]|uniref:RRM domain-containing protein n=1 Tax=Raphidocelis subcapitata TaxID=307507 RepID=A0A2V0PA79_9CHLO|nr:hypothetical protein Rsub_07283 [Raphidocelis subcapitata]|eukprot:GBF94015.1 hypothetical protein Rsub_07283 [Raphidocelis subcapitata]
MPAPPGGKRSGARAAAAAPAAAAAAPSAAPQPAMKSLGLQLRKDSSLICYVFLKAHQPKDEAQQPGQQQPGQQQQEQAQQQQQAQNTVFVAGLPLGLSEEDVGAVLSCFGDVAGVVMHHTKRSCVVVFAEAASARRALAAAGSGQVVEYEPPAPEGPRGLKAWVQQHKAARPGAAALQKQLDEWGRKRARDAGGVSTVSGGVAQAAAEAAAAAEGKKGKQYEDFYRFQQRDKRRNDLVELRRRFEEDRRRISELRAARNFKPY